MPFCVPESEYDPLIHEYVSGPNDSCSGCATVFPTGSGFNVRLGSVAVTPDGAEVSIIFLGVDVGGETTVRRHPDGGNDGPVARTAIAGGRGAGGSIVCQRQSLPEPSCDIGTTPAFRPHPFGD
jgi:hypothetical protein